MKQEGTSTILIYSPQCHTYPVTMKQEGNNNYMKQEDLSPIFKQKFSFSVHFC